MNNRAHRQRGTRRSAPYAAGRPFSAGLLVKPIPFNAPLHTSVIGIPFAGNRPTAGSGQRSFIGLHHPHNASKNSFSEITSSSAPLATSSRACSSARALICVPPSIRAALEAMLGAMKDSFPMFRRYFKHKAKMIGKEQLAWWDLFAPLGKTDKVYSWEEARDFIVANFNKFSPELGAFARRAFDNNWIDGEQREGKRGGAFCMGLDAVKESRILANFDGSFDQVSTLAHELGHAFHNECAYAANKTPLQQQTPMTLAETASIMCETIATEAALEQTTDKQEVLAILEAQLNNASQVVVDIYSRYLFEKEVFERRAKAELSADEINDIMERAQKATYGDGLDEKYLQKYMWTWKPHYYSAGLSFYNYPYSFGLLFATGLYAVYQKRGEDFVPAYKELLASTGEAPAAELADKFGINIRTKKFWADSLAIIGKRVDRFCEL